MELFLLYLFTRIGTFQFLLVASTIACLISWVITFAVVGDHCADTTHCKIVRAKAYAWRKGAFIVFWPLLVVSALIPTQRDVALLVAGWGVVEVVKSETAGRLASKSVSVIEKALDTYLVNEVAKEK